MSYIFKEDQLRTYQETIDQELAKYNLERTKNEERSHVYIYLFDFEKMVAGLHANIGWDWIHFNTLFYQTRDQLYTLLNEAHKEFGHQAIGSMISSSTPFLIEDFLSAGYEIHKKIEHIPYEKKRVTLINKHKKQLSIKQDFLTIVSNKEVDPYHKQLIEQGKEFDTKLYEYMGQSKDLCFVCLDNDVCIGGVLGSIQNHTLSIDALYVDKAHRNKQIASRLMDMIEKEAVKHHAKIAYLGTGSFQAPDFYHKLGYKIVMTVDDFPKGFKNHTMLKTLM